MKSGAWKHFALAGILAMALYVVSYSSIEYLRQRKGGWQVMFSSDASGEPAVRVTQPALSLTDIQFRFPGEKISASNLHQTIVFDHPITNVPFGRVVFIDTTFLPGTVTFDLFGHEVELLPRVLIVNKREVPWQSNQSLNFSPDEKRSVQKRKTLPPSH
jgi:hypothetical protein